jgi:hypothetical protein
VVGHQEPVNPNIIQTWFGSMGFANAVRYENQKDLKFFEVFKSSQYKRISDAPTGPAIDVLAVPVKGPASWAITFNKTTVNPWLYVSTSPTNNPDRYDLWTEVILSGKTVRFSNWEKDPVVLTP